MGTNVELANENVVCTNEKLDCVTQKLGHDPTDHRLDYFIPPRDNEIGVDKSFRWTLDGDELRHHETIEIKIDAHWILGVIIKHEGTWVWSSWRDMVVINITFGLKARRPAQTKTEVKP